MKTRLALVAVAAIALGSQAAFAQQDRFGLNSGTAADRAERGIKGYNPAVPQGCDAVEKGFCIRVTKELDVETPPTAGGAAPPSNPPRR